MSRRRKTRSTPAVNGVVAGIAVTLAIIAGTHSCDQQRQIQQEVSRQHHG